VPVILADPVQIEVIVVGAIHVVFIARVLVARRAAARQRTADLERFQQMKQRT
jgi:hypothetical protein